MLCAYKEIGRRLIRLSGRNLHVRALTRLRWGGAVHLSMGSGCRTPAKDTKPTLIYRRTRNLRAVQLLLGHSKLESTVRYLGIEVDDALEIAEQTEV